MHYQSEDAAYLLNRYLLPTITVCVGTFLSIVGFIPMLNVGLERLQKNSAALKQAQIRRHRSEAGYLAAAGAMMGGEIGAESRRQPVCQT